MSVLGAGSGTSVYCLVCGANCTNHFSEPAPGVIVCRIHRNMSAAEIMAAARAKTNRETAKPKAQPMTQQNTNFSKLIKLLKMTTSSNDAEALVATRMANEQLQKLGWDWEKLLTQRVTVVADPFNDAPVIRDREAKTHTLSDVNEAYNRGYAAAVNDAQLRKSQRANQQSSGAQTGRFYSPPPRPKRAKRTYPANGVTLGDLGL